MSLSTINLIGTSGSLQAIAAGLASLSETKYITEIDLATIHVQVEYPATPDGNPLIELQAGVFSPDGTLIGWDSIAFTQFEMSYYRLTGAADATEANKLHDADGGFLVDHVGRIVNNTTDGTSTTIAAFVDSGELTLTDDIFVNGESWAIQTSVKSHIVNAAPEAFRIKVTNQNTAQAINVWAAASLFRT